MTNPRRAIVGGLIVVGAAATFFWWGFHFHVFGSDIDWLNHPAQLGFPALIVIAAFGAAYPSGGWRSGLKAMSWTAGLLLAATIIGQARNAI
jgi:hypothetical protein